MHNGKNLKDKHMNKSIDALKPVLTLALDALEWNLPVIEDYGTPNQLKMHHKALTTIYEALADIALDKMAENARELGLDYEPIIEQVEDSVGMGHGAWDMVEPKKLAKAFHKALAEQPAPATELREQQEPVAIEYWLQDTMESGRWVTTDNMAKATAEKMLSGEYGDVYPQGRIVEPSPPPSKPLTDEEIEDIWNSYCDEMGEASINDAPDIARAIESGLRSKNT